MPNGLPPAKIAPPSPPSPPLPPVTVSSSAIGSGVRRLEASLWPTVPVPPGDPLPLGLPPLAPFMPLRPVMILTVGDMGTPALIAGLWGRQARHETRCLSLATAQGASPGARGICQVYEI